MFEDLLQANRRYATSAPREFDGYAHAGIAVVTCMDSRLQPLHMIGLFVGEAKILRTPGAHVTPDALNGCILGVNLLRVRRILVVAHTRCAMASCDDDEMRPLMLAHQLRGVLQRVLGRDRQRRCHGGPACGAI